MDFHSLTRKELQALCKINKIAANQTNVAMADSLFSLQHVEGIEGTLNPSQSGADETTIAGTPVGPRTSCRTSTRPRKPVIMEVSQSMTRTRRATREVVEEVKEESRDFPSKTPAARSTLRRAPVPSAAKKTEIGSVQRAYSTRRSVKLLEETMEKMCLGNDVPVMTDELSKEVSSVKIEEGSPEMQMELKYDVYDDAVKVVESGDEKVDVKNETLIEEVVDCEPVADLSNEIQNSIIKDVEVSKETVEAISSNASSAVIVESDEEEVKSKEASLVVNKDSSQSKVDIVSESITTESNVKIVEVEENKSFDATQFPRRSLPKTCKSSAEVHPVIQKIENVLDEDEDEEFKVKNDNNTASKKLEDKSLRELHKMLKAKLANLQITKDEKDSNTTRIALQPLHENRLAVDELQKN